MKTINASDYAILSLSIAAPIVFELEESIFWRLEYFIQNPESRNRKNYLILAAFVFCLIYYFLYKKVPDKDVFRKELIDAIIGYTNFGFKEQKWEMVDPPELKDIIKSIIQYRNNNSRDYNDEESLSAFIMCSLSMIDVKSNDDIRNWTKMISCCGVIKEGLGKFSDMYRFTC